MACVLVLLQLRKTTVSLVPQQNSAALNRSKKHGLNGPPGWVNALMRSTHLVTISEYSRSVWTKWPPCDEEPFHAVTDDLALFTQLVRDLPDVRRSLPR